MEEPKKSLSKKSQKAQEKEPLLVKTPKKEKEGEPTEQSEGMSLNALNYSVTHPNTRLQRFLNTIGLNLEELSEFVSEQGKDPETFIQTLQQLFDHEKSCSSGFKWAALDHLIEKYLQWPLLSKSDLSGDSKCCTARVQPAQRSILLKSLSGLVKSYGIRGFVKGVEFTLSRSVRYFIYSMLIYRMVEWYKTGSLEFTEFQQLFKGNTQKGIDTLVHVLSEVEPLYLNLILSAPLMIGSFYGINGMRGAKRVAPLETQNIIQQAEARSNPKKGNFWRDTVQEMLPIISISALSQKIEKLERMVRWDGRISEVTRLEIFKAIHQIASEGHQITQLRAMECLAKIAHGIGFKDLPKLTQADYSSEEIKSILYTKVVALEALQKLTQPAPSHRILPLPRRLYATYLIWWLGVSTSYVKQKIPFSVFKAAKTALEISFLYEITKSIITAINCPDKPGFQFAEGYAEWASDYSLECFNTVFRLFRSIDSKESIDQFASRIYRYHLSELKKLDLSDKSLNSTDLYTLLRAIAQKAPEIEELKSIGGNIFEVLIPGTFQGLNNLQYLFFMGCEGYQTCLPFETIPRNAFQGLSQLKGLTLQLGKLSNLTKGSFEGLNQLKELSISILNSGPPLLFGEVFQGLVQLEYLRFYGGFYKEPFSLPAELFQGLGQLKSLVFGGPFISLPDGIFFALSQLQNLDLSHNYELNSLPDGIFSGLSQLQNLDLSSNYELNSLPDGIFSGLSQLQNLDLSSNFELNSLPDGIFFGLSQLQGLDLRYNYELSLSDRVFAGLQKLQNLSVGGKFSNLSFRTFQDLNQLQYLDLSFSEFTSLPTGVFHSLSQLRSLSLSFPKLSSLPARVFQDLNQLQSLDLSFSELTSLPTEAFYGLSQLQSLSLSFPKLSSLPARVFQGLSQLRNADLSFSKLSSLPVGVFQNWDQLQSLNLDCPELTNLSAGVFQGLKQLKNLDLNFPELTVLPTEIFQGLGQLQHLRLYGKFLSLPDGIFSDLGLLQSLDLSENYQLNILSDRVFSGLSQLKNLNLCGNYELSLSDGIFAGLQQLQNLGLSTGYLSSRRVFQGLSQLQHLGLGTISLSEGIFQDLNQLKSLDLSQNSFTNLPAGVFQGLDQLRYLDLSWSGQLTMLPAGVFQGLSQLQHLDLSWSTQLTMPSAGVFQGLSQLQYLDLNHCSFNSLPARMFQGLSQLETLDLSNNYYLTTLDVKVFEGLSGLQTLDLHYGNIFSGDSGALTTLEIGIFAGLNQLKNLYLMRNELNDIAIFNLTQNFPYQLTNLDVRYNYIGDDGFAALIKILPCSNLQVFDFYPSRLFLNDTTLLLQQQRKIIERVCSDRACHANLPSQSCPADSFYGRQHSKDTLTQPSAFYGLHIDSPWAESASLSLPAISNCDPAVSNHMLITATGSAVVIGSVGLGILFYKNCTLLQSVVHTGWGFVQQCFYGKKEQQQVAPAESEEPSVHAANVGTQTKRSSVCSIFATFFFKPKTGVTPQTDPNPSAKQSLRV